MKKLIFAEIEFSKKALKLLEEGKTSLKEGIENHISYLTSHKYKDGMDLKSQKMFTKVSDKLSEAIDDVELSDEQFDFVFDVVTTAQVPPNLYTAPIAEHLEKMKLK